MTADDFDEVKAALGFSIRENFDNQNRGNVSYNILKQQKCCLTQKREHTSLETTPTGWIIKTSKLKFYLRETL